MYARIGTFEVPLPNLDKVLSILEDDTVPRFSKHEGFLGYQAYADRERGRVTGISMWATLADLMASGETGRHAVRKVAGFGATVVGTMQIMEFAFDARSSRTAAPAVRGRRHRGHHPM